MEAEGTTAEGRSTGSCDDGANRQPTAGAAGSDRAKRLEVDSGPTASGYRNHGSHRLRQATHPTQSSSSFDPDGGRQARFTDSSQSAATKSGSGVLIDLTTEDPVISGGTTEFLRVFPTKQHLKTRLPELGGMNPFEYNSANDFEEALDRELGEKESTRLKQRFAPAVIQSGLKQLMAQDSQGELAPSGTAEEDVTFLFQFFASHLRSSTGTSSTCSSPQVSTNLSEDTASGLTQAVGAHPSGSHRLGILPFHSLAGTASRQRVGCKLQLPGA